MAEFQIAEFNHVVTAADLDALIGNPLLEEEDVD